MRSLPAAFTASLLQTTHPTLFWSAVAHFPSPRNDIYLVGPHPVDSEPLTISGNAHEQVVMDWGTLNTAISRSARTLDISTFDLQINNFLSLSSGERWSDLFRAGTEQIETDFYLNVVAADATISQALWYTGIIEAAEQYGIPLVTHRVKPLSEKYLTREATRIISDRSFSFARQSDIGKTIPIAIGSVKKALARITKARTVSTSVSDAENLSTAILQRATARAAAGIEDWIVTVATSETQQQLTTDGEAEVGKKSTAIAFDAASNASSGATQYGVTSLTWAHTCSGSHLCLEVALAFSSAPTQVTGVTYAGIPLRLVANYYPGNLSGSPQIWQLIDPPSGTANIIVSLSSTAIICATAMSFAECAGAKLTSTGYVSASTSGETAAIVATLPDKSSGDPDAVADTDKLIDIIVGGFGNPTAASPTPASDQTAHGDNTSNDNGYRYGYERQRASHAPGISNRDTSWTVTKYSNKSWFLLNANLTRRRDVFATSWEPTGSQKVVGCRLPLRKNPSTTLTSPTARLALCSDSGGYAGTVLATASATITSTTASWVQFYFSPLVNVTGGATYHLRLISDADSANVGGVLWSKNSAGGYANGVATQGLADVGDAVLWTTTLTGQDFAFAIDFSATGPFTLVGSVTGADGTGDIFTDFTSTSGKISIAASAWRGTPTSGDRYYFTSDGSPQRAVVSESPIDTPIGELGQVTWNGDAITTGGTLVDVTGGTVGGPTYLGGTTHVRVAESFLLTTATLLKSIAVKELEKTGTPPGAKIMCSVFPAIIDTISSRYKPDETQAAVGTASILISALTTSLASYTFDFSASPVLLQPGNYAAVLSYPEGDTATSSNGVAVGYRTANPYADGAYCSSADSQSSGLWTVMSDNDLQITVVGATITTELSIVDEEGEYVAEVRFDVEIPDDVEIRVDILTGITDDAAGTFTGVAGGTISIPTDVFHFGLRRSGAPHSVIDLSGSFAASRARFGSTYRFGGLIGDDGPITWKEVFLKLAFECRSAFTWLDKAKLQYLPDPPIAADKTLGYGDIVAESVGPVALPRISFKREKSQLVNDIELQWSRVFGENRYERVTGTRNETSVAAFGRRADPDLFKCDFVRAEAMAIDLGAFWLRWFAVPPRIATATLPLAFFDLEPDDKVAFNLVPVLDESPAPGALPGDLPMQLADAFDGLDGGQVFLIEREEIDFGQPPSITIEAREL